MKVLHIGWWTSEFIGNNGAILHVETLMEYLNRSGIKNHYFCGGRYNLLFSRTYIKKWGKYYVDIYELVNSPNLVGYSGNPEIHVMHENIEKAFLEVMGFINPDIIHIHTTESLCGSIIKIAREKGLPVVVDIHNYWYLCHQINLIGDDRNLCTDFKEGERCVSCSVSQVVPRIGWMYVGYLRNTVVGKLVDPIAWKVYKLIKEQHKRKNIQKRNSLEMAILYKRRRDFFVSELNLVDAIIFPSKRTFDIYSRYKVHNKNSIILFPINKSYLYIKPKKPDMIKDRKRIRFGYIGAISPHKGVHLIIDAVERLKEFRDSFEVYIYGGGDVSYIDKLKGLAPSNVFFKGRYSPEYLQEVLNSIDIGIVPSIWEECFGIVLNELKLSKTPIIGSKIGGIEEQIAHGINGYLFTPGDSLELAGYMMEFIKNPNRICQFMEAIDFSFDIDAYIGNIKGIYDRIRKT